jgi:hypothetical protein
MSTVDIAEGRRLLAAALRVEFEKRMRYLPGTDVVAATGKITSYVDASYARVMDAFDRAAEALLAGTPDLDVQRLARAMLTTELDGYKPEDWWQVSGMALGLFRDWAARAAAEYARLREAPDGR